MFEMPAEHYSFLRFSASSHECLTTDLSCVGTSLECDLLCSERANPTPPGCRQACGAWGLGPDLMSAQVFISADNPPALRSQRPVVWLKLLLTSDSTLMLTVSQITAECIRNSASGIWQPPLCLSPNVTIPDGSGP